MWWWNWKKIPAHLPYAKGPHVPGCTDVMTEYSKEGIFLRLYYPTSLSNIEDFSNDWIPWISHERYVQGFSKILHIWKFVVKFIIWLLAGDIKIPVVWNADVYTGSKLPVILFSHGLGGSRFFYSTLCADLASHGFLVAAMEHRDHSASATFYLKIQDSPAPHWIDYEEVPFGLGHYGVRFTQVHQRTQDCVKSYNYLNNLNNGITVKSNVLDEQFDIHQLEDRLDMSNTVMMGHSFGGATALLALAVDPRLSCGVILDAWMFPVKEYTALSEAVREPVLFVNTWTFHTSPNYEALHKFIDSKDERTAYTIRGTTHETQTDTPHVFGYWLNFWMKKLRPSEALEINNHLILDFLQNKMGIGQKPNTSSAVLAQNAHNIVDGLVQWND